MPYYKPDGSTCTIAEWQAEKAKASSIIGTAEISVAGETIRVVAKYVGLRPSALFKVYLECSEENEGHSDYLDYFEEQTSASACETEFNRIVAELEALGGG